MPFFISREKFEYEVSRRVAETCEQIITEMGAELHDHLVQKLSIFRLYIDQLSRVSSDRIEVETLSIRMKSEFEHVVEAVRAISKKLLPTAMTGGSFSSHIEMLCRNMEQPSTGYIHFENLGTPRNLPHKTEVHLFRIIQELIHNAFKHSAAWHIWVRLKWDPLRLIVEVEDDGSGFSKQQEFIRQLRRKHNTLRIRSQIIEASLRYEEGTKGLLARVIVETKTPHKIPLRKA